MVTHYPVAHRIDFVVCLVVVARGCGVAPDCPLLCGTAVIAKQACGGRRWLLRPLYYAPKAGRGECPGQNGMALQVLVLALPCAVRWLSVRGTIVVQVAAIAFVKPEGFCGNVNVSARHCPRIASPSSVPLRCFESEMGLTTFKECGTSIRI